MKKSNRDVTNALEHIQNTLDHHDKHLLNIQRGLEYGGTQLTAILNLVREISGKEDLQMAEIDNLKAGLDTLETEVAGIKDVEASAEATLTALVAKAAELQKQLQDAINAGNPAEIQAAADRLAAQNAALDAAKSSLAAAIANVPA